MYIRCLSFIIMLFVVHSASYGMYRQKPGDTPAFNISTDQTLENAWKTIRALREMEIKGDLASIVLAVGFFNDNLMNNVLRRQDQETKAVTRDQATQFFLQQLGIFFLEHLPKGKTSFTMADLGKAGFDGAKDGAAIKKVLLVLIDLTRSFNATGSNYLADPEVKAIDYEILSILDKVKRYVSEEVICDLETVAGKLRAETYNETIYTGDLLPEIVFSPDQIKVNKKSVHYLTNLRTYELFRQTLKSVNDYITAVPENNTFLKLAKQLEDFYKITPQIFDRKSNDHTEQLIAAVQAILYTQCDLNSVEGEFKNVRTTLYTRLTFADIATVIAQVLACNSDDKGYDNETAREALSWLVLTRALISLSEKAPGKANEHLECRQHFQKHLDRLVEDMSTEQMISIYSFTGRWLGKSVETLPTLTAENAFGTDSLFEVNSKLSMMLGEQKTKEFMLKALKYIDEYHPKTHTVSSLVTWKPLTSDKYFLSGIDNLCSDRYEHNPIDVFLTTVHARIVKYPSILMLRHVLVAIKEYDLADELGKF